MRRHRSEQNGREGLSAHCTAFLQIGHFIRTDTFNTSGGNFTPAQHIFYLFRFRAFGIFTRLKTAGFAKNTVQ